MLFFFRLAFLWSFILSAFSSETEEKNLTCKNTTLESESTSRGLDDIKDLIESFHKLESPATEGLRVQQDRRLWHDHQKRKKIVNPKIHQTKELIVRAMAENKAEELNNLLDQFVASSDLTLDEKNELIDQLVALGEKVYDLESKRELEQKVGRIAIILDVEGNFKQWKIPQEIDAHGRSRSERDLKIFELKKLEQQAMKASNLLILYNAKSSLIDESTKLKE